MTAEERVQNLIDLVKCKPGEAGNLGLLFAAKVIADGFWLDQYQVQIQGLIEQEADRQVALDVV